MTGTPQDNLVTLATTTRDVDVNRPEPNQDVIAYLEKALARAKCGDCIGFAGVQFDGAHLDHTYILSTVGDVRYMTMLGGVEMLSDSIRESLNTEIVGYTHPEPTKDMDDDEPAD